MRNFYANDEVFEQTLKIVTQLEVNTAQQNIFQVVVSELDDKHFVNFFSSNQTEYWQKWITKFLIFQHNN